MDDKLTKLPDNNGVKESTPASSGFAVSLAGLLLALVLFSGIEGVLNKVEVTLIENSRMIVPKQGGYLSLLPKQLAQVNSLIDQRYQDVSYGLKVSEKGFIDTSDKVKKIFINDWQYLVNLTKNIKREAMLIRLASNQKIFITSLKFVQLIEVAVLKTEDISIKSIAGLYNQGQNLIVQINDLGIQAMTSTKSYTNQTIDSLTSTGLSLSSQTANTWSSTGQSLRTSSSNFFRAISDYITVASTNSKIYFRQIVNNWRSFVFGTSKKQKQLEADLLRQQLKQEILAEVNDEIKTLVESQGLVTAPSLFESKNGQGVVILPKTDNLSEGEIKNNLQTMFSDKVTVKFDSSGQSGIITPIFKTTTGRDYIFVLTPIKGN